MNRRPQIRRLRHMLQNPDSAVRKQAITMLTTIRNPNALWTLRYVAQNDTDAEVRTLAQQAVKQRVQRLQAMMGTQGSSAQEVHWDCVFCGTRDIQGAACQNCGAPRPTEADEKAAASADNNVSAPNPFIAGPGGVPPIMGMRGRWGWGARRRANGAGFIFMLMVLLMCLLMFTLLYASNGRHFLDGF